MSNYWLLSGPFEGSVVEEGPLLDVDFHELDDDLQCRIMEFSGIENLDWYTLAELNQFKCDYEGSWDAEETYDEVTTLPASEWE